MLMSSIKQLLFTFVLSTFILFLIIFLGLRANIDTLRLSTVR